MRVLLQRVHRANVTVDDQIVGSIGRGYLLFIGIMNGDTEEQARWLAAKVVKLRLYDAPDGKVNDKNIMDVGGEILVVSQFTLAGRTEDSNRPDYTSAAKPAEAEKLYERFIVFLREQGLSKVETGTFRAMMNVELVNDGPVTLMLER